MQLFLAIELVLLALFVLKAAIANIERNLLRPPIRHDATDRLEVDRDLYHAPRSRSDTGSER